MFPLSLIETIFLLGFRHGFDYRSYDFIWYDLGMQKGFTPILILLGVLVITGIVGGVYFKFNREETPNTRLLNSNNPEGQNCGHNAGLGDNYSCPQDHYCKYTTIHKDKGACVKVTGWNTYVSENKDYEFKYPSDLVFYTSKGSVCDFLGFLGIPADKNISQDGYVSENFSVSFCLMKGYNNPKEFHYSVSAVNGEIMQKDNPTVRISKLNGYDLAMGQWENPSGSLKNFAAISDNKNRFLQIEVHPGDANLLDQILSTFKFN